MGVVVGRGVCWVLLGMLGVAEDSGEGLEMVEEWTV